MKINYEIFGPGNVKAKIFTLDGILVKSLYEAETAKGAYSLEWDATNTAGEKVASGVYVLFLQGPELNLTKKIVVVR